MKLRIIPYSFLALLFLVVPLTSAPLSDDPAKRIFHYVCKPYYIDYVLQKQDIRHFEFEIRLTYGTHQDAALFESVETGWVADNLKAALKEMKHLTGVKKGYLFVPESCGGCNAWRGQVENVYKIHGGMPRKIGRLACRNDHEPGSSLGKDGFWDYFDGLEINAYTCHAASPGFAVALNDSQDHLTLDVERTWIMNQGVLKGYLDGIRRNDLRDDRKEELKSEYLGAMALAKLCGKELVWKSTLDIGKKAFGNSLAVDMSNAASKSVESYLTRYSKP